MGGDASKQIENELKSINEVCLDNKCCGCGCGCNCKLVYIGSDIQIF